MQGNSIRKKITTLLVMIILVILVVTCLYQHNQIRDLKRNREQAKSDLLTFYSATNYPVSYAFNRVKANHSKENLHLLFTTLLNQQRKIETLIELNKSHINLETWHSYLNRPNTQAIMYVNYLSEHVNKVNNSDLERLNKMEVIWNSFQKEIEPVTQEAPIGITKPNQFTKSYTKFIKKLDQIRGINNWINN